MADVPLPIAVGGTLVAAFTLLFAILRYRYMKQKDRREFQRNVRTSMDDAIAMARGIPPRIEELKHEQLGFAAQAGLLQSGRSIMLETQRENLLEKSQRCLHELEELDTNLSRKSLDELDRFHADVVRHRRTLDEVSGPIADAIQEVETSRQRQREASEGFRLTIKRP